MFHLLVRGAKHETRLSRALALHPRRHRGGIPHALARLSAPHLPRLQSRPQRRGARTHLVERLRQRAREVHQRMQSHHRPSSPPSARLREPPSRRPPHRHSTKSGERTIRTQKKRQPPLPHRRATADQRHVGKPISEIRLVSNHKEIRRAERENRESQHHLSNEERRVCGDTQNLATLREKPILPHSGQFQGTKPREPRITKSHGLQSGIPHLEPSPPWLLPLRRTFPSTDKRHCHPLRDMVLHRGEPHRERATARC